MDSLRIMALLMLILVALSLCKALCGAWKRGLPSVTGLLRRCTPSSKVAATDPEVRREVEVQLSARRVHCAKLVSSGAWTAECLFCAQLVAQIIAGESLPKALVAIHVAMLGVLTAAGFFPRALVNERTLAYLHLWFMLLACCAALAPVDRDEQPRLRESIMVGSIVYSGLCLRFKVLVTTNALLYVAIVAGMILADGSFESQAWRSHAIGELAITLFKLVIFYAAEFAVDFSTTLEVQAKFGKRQQSAISALLDMMCDAVVDMDDGLRMKDHFPKFAGILMHSTGRTLHGSTLTSFIAEGEDRAKFDEVVQRSQAQEVGEMTPSMLTVRMRDSIGNLLRVVLFHVPYISLGGSLHHLVGLREDTDGTGGDRVRVPDVSVGSFRMDLPAAILRPEFAQRQQMLQEAGLPRQSASSRQSSSSDGSGGGSRRHLCKRSVHDRATAVEAYSGFITPDVDELAGDLRCSVYVEPGLPVRWAAPALRQDLGVAAGAFKRLGDVLPNGGQALYAWIEAEMDEAMRSGNVGGFAKCFGDAELEPTAVGGVAKTHRRLLVHFPAPLQPRNLGSPAEATRYCITVGISHDAGDVEPLLPLPSTDGVEAQRHPVVAL